MTNEEMLAAITAHIDARLDAMQEQINNVQEQINNVEERLSGQIEDLKEDCEITRDGVNSLLEWADIVGKITNYPIAT